MFKPLRGVETLSKSRRLFQIQKLQNQVTNQENRIWPRDSYDLPI